MKEKKMTAKREEEEEEVVEESGAARKTKTASKVEKKETRISLRFKLSWAMAD